MIQETRRQILKLIGMSPVAASSATAELTGLMAGPTGTLLSAASAVVQPSQPLPSDNPVMKAVGPTIFRRLAGLHNRVDRELSDSRAIRQNGLDADIAVFRSTSQTWKARKQFERDSEAFDLYTRLQGMLWP